MQMLEEVIASYVKKLNISGVLHIGANLCQEISTYQTVYGIDPARMIWVEAIPHIAEFVREKGIQNVYQAVLSDSSGVVDFQVTNNFGCSSSILKLYAHKYYHPDVHVQEVLKLQTQTLSSWLAQVKLDPSLLEFVVMDIQGAELQVLRGSPEALRSVKVLVTEINLEELYKGCGVYSDLVHFMEMHGFVEVAKHTSDTMSGDAVFVRREFV